MCATFASAIHYHSLHYAVVGLTNGKCTATPMTCAVHLVGVSCARDSLDHSANCAVVKEYVPQVGPCYSNVAEGLL